MRNKLLNGVGFVCLFLCFLNKKIQCQNTKEALLPLTPERKCPFREVLIIDAEEHCNI